MCMSPVAGKMAFIIAMMAEKNTIAEHTESIAYEDEVTEEVITSVNERFDISVCPLRRLKLFA